MNKSVLGIIIAVLAVGGIVGVLFATNQESTSPTNTTSSQTNSQDTSPPATDNDGNTESTNNQSSGNQSAAQSSSVEIRNSAFSPSRITVKKGTTVTWTNRDNIEHDVQPDNPSDAFQGSELLDQGESYSFTFNTAGTYTYHCTPHPFMRGTVEVTE